MARAEDREPKPRVVRMLVSELSESGRRRLSGELTECEGELVANADISVLRQLDNLFSNDGRRSERLRQLQRTFPEARLFLTQSGHHFFGLQGAESLQSIESMQPAERRLRLGSQLPE